VTYEYRTTSAAGCLTAAVQPPMALPNEAQWECIAMTVWAPVPAGLLCDGVRGGLVFLWRRESAVNGRWSP
jgi:hypothetical protein